MFKNFRIMKYNFLKKGFLILIFASLHTLGYAQGYWQQRVEYQMDIKMDVSTDRLTGTQSLKYYNNSPDTLKKVFYHLYFNAFQPESMMDVRSRTIEDPDNRVRDRIVKLEDSEIGYQKVSGLTQDGKAVESFVEGTVLEVTLAEPILPGASSTFNMTFEGQVPLQIRRSGRDNAEGIEYSMAQWFPKMAEYDKDGWHPTPYIAREFYAPWGDYNVNITIDKNYVVAASGVLQNPNEIGYGYEDPGVSVKTKGKELTWKFKAENVHDFVWTADPDYVHKTAQVPNGPVLHFFYQEGSKTNAWNELPPLAVKAFDFIQKNFGEYPYPHYSVIQGGDGGMEYPMATLITGERSLQSLLGVTVHEGLHSWYQGLLATNESYYAWMDEGFTTYASAETMAYTMAGSDRTQAGNYRNYFSLARSGKEEPLSTHSDHFSTNLAYGRGSYSKGAVALAQMNYIIGKEKTASALKKYYYQWRFKHPDAKDWIRVFEKESGLVLDWYYDYWVNTTHTIDYAIDQVEEKENQTLITLWRRGKMPMPVDVYVTFSDGTKKIYYVPLASMRGEKENDSNLEREIKADWSWTHPTYPLMIDRPLGDIVKIQIDESGYMADINPDNNTWEKD